MTTVVDGIRIVTNGVPRDIVEPWEVTPAERRELDYLDWPALEAGEDSASFFRYRGNLYDLGEFEVVRPDRHPHFAGWHGYQTDSYFTATLVRYADEQCERVVVGRASW